MEKVLLIVASIRWVCREVPIVEYVALQQNLVTELI